MKKKAVLKAMIELQKEHPQLSLGKLEDLPENATSDVLHKIVHLIKDNAEDYLRDSVNNLLRRI